MASVYVIMGVSGCGKTTVGQLLAAELGLPFFDADHFHSPENIKKMSEGIPLNDADRLPWLKALASRITSWNAANGAVLACSALKESYRKILAEGNELEWVVLTGSYEIIMERMTERSDHYMEPKMLRSQFDTLEIPAYGLHLNISCTPEKLVSIITKYHMMQKSEFGIIGMGVMGRSLALNVLDKNIPLSVYNRVDGNEAYLLSEFLGKADAKQVSGFTSMEKFVDSLAIPRKILLMIPAGAAVDAVLTALDPYLSENDIVIDGGNSHYCDTKRRHDALAKKNIRFLGVGISGGEQGALHGPSMMAGGAREGYDQIKRILEAISAKDAHGTPCVTYLGPDGCGHFVKMIHNGIEYAEMQLLAELFSILKQRLSYPKISKLFREWNATELSSFLLEITATILTVKEDNHYLLDRILDTASSKGTGAWSAEAALELGVPASMISASVEARFLSMLKEKRVNASQKPDSAAVTPEIDLDVVKNAYAFARLINHYQGFEIIRSASGENDWHVSLSEIARLWTNGCIIRSALVSSLADRFKKNEDLMNDETIVRQMVRLEGSVRKLINAAFNSRIALPAFSSALNYWYALTTGNSSANLIQAQRDYFGAHGYGRTDSDPGLSFTTDWSPHHG